MRHRAPVDPGPLPPVVQKEYSHTTGRFFRDVQTEEERQARAAEVEHNRNWDKAYTAWSYCNTHGMWLYHAVLMLV